MFSLIVPHWTSPVLSGFPIGQIMFPGVFFFLYPSAKRHGEGIQRTCWMQISLWCFTMVVIFLDSDYHASRLAPADSYDRRGFDVLKRRGDALRKEI